LTSSYVFITKGPNHAICSRIGSPPQQQLEVFRAAVLLVRRRDSR